MQWRSYYPHLGLVVRYGAHGSKVTRHISFSERLDLRPFMSVPRAPPVWYRLYAVLVHNGPTTKSGHYYCYVRGPAGTWHCMNDSSVSDAVVFVRYYKFISIFVPDICITECLVCIALILCAVRLLIQWLERGKTANTHTHNCFTDLCLGLPG